ncbi:uncharacterized protein LTHEOB_11840 [Lasiodiplodia theobromae]|nr:uncharacterized protein LTHEOB_11840 [Lasiodiplodia theobromae]KAF4536972.1 hypothetical protein LTHEOB_11840 [Lasiodiplodia theobromae]
MLSAHFATMDDFLQDFWTYHIYTDSWIEVASQPSSSSLSSTTSATDEIITDGLRVQHDSNSRRRRQQRASRLHLDLGYRGSGSAGTSSQEEYEESESESDRVLSSSNEALPRAPVYQDLRRTGRVQYSSSDNQSDEEEDDEDENSTAVGYLRSDNQSFTPQPNAFTHPPSAPLNRPSNEQTSYFQSRPSARSAEQRHSYTSQPAHSPYNMIAPSHQADHDAALRASLSTLLSCAAAARGLPKSQSQTTTTRNAPAPSSSRVDPSTLRMVPESALPSSSPSPPVTSVSKPPTTRTNTASPKSGSSEEKHKRRSSRERRGSTKKARRAAGAGAVAASSSTSLDDNSATTALGQVSPTLLTWVVSAGVVVLVSALSFSAGYVVGRDAGRAEVEMLGEMGANASNVGSCASEVVGRGGTGLGLRRLRFSDAVRVS